MTINKCKTCGEYISEFSPSTTYCSKACEVGKEDNQVESLMKMFGMK